MVVIEQRCDPGSAIDARLVLPFELRQKARLRTRLDSGEEAGLFLERGGVLRGGDCLLAQDGRVIGVVAAAEHVLTIRAESRRELARVAYHLGNRHVPLEVGDGFVRIGFDSVLRDMAQRFDVRVVEEHAAFEPEPGAYAHAGTHAHRSHG